MDKKFDFISKENRFPEDNLGNQCKPEEVFALNIDSKYRLILYKNGVFECKRYEQPWRTLTGDKLILALVQEIISLRTENAGLVPNTEQSRAIEKVERL